ncbi:MAG: hypothetical protein H6Q19_441 [Bacteroidetes bacterium]|nr:hypothetical protein [Bacteroidota bacterium]
MKKFTLLLSVLLLTCTSLLATDLTVTGAFPDNNWNNSNSAFLMTEIGTSGVYSLERTLPAGDYEFKVLYTGTWNGASGGNAKFTLTSEKAVKFYAKDNGSSISFLCDAQTFYIVGSSVGGWDAASMKSMTSTTAEATYTADVVAGDYKIVSLNGTNIVWDYITPSNMNIAGSGNYTIKLDFTSFAVTSTANGSTTPSLSSISSSYIFTGQDPATAAWYNASATYQSENFNGKNLGSITAPLYLGGELTTAPVRDGVTVKMFYQIDDLAVNEINLPWDSNDGTTSSKWKSTAGTNVFSAYTLTKGTTYNLKVWFNATEGTVTLWDSNNSANYIATFVYDQQTGIDAPEPSIKISGVNRTIKALFDGEAQIDLFTMSGQLLRSTKASGEFVQPVDTGAYILRINGTAHKLLVH